MVLTEAQKKAQRKWREKNKEHVRMKNIEAFHRWYEKNKEEHNKRALISYHKRRMEVLNAKVTPDITIVA